MTEISGKTHIFPAIGCRDMNQKLHQRTQSHNLPDRMSFLSCADTQHLGYCGKVIHTT